LERRWMMKKIVLFTQREKDNRVLIEWLKTLFPETEIQLVFRDEIKESNCENPYRSKPH
jgi:hypothetical protein